jgi:Ca2+-binding EF-hand superfamily protein
MFFRTSLLLLFASVTGVFAAETPNAPPPEVRWMTRIMLGSPTGLPLTLDQAERNMLRVYRTMNGGLPRFSDLARRLDQVNREPRQRAQLIARFLEKDFDNDGTVTTDELKTFLEPQTQTMLQSTTGIQVEPTVEQMDEITRQLLAKDLLADTNGDGSIDFQEMRTAAALKLPARLSNIQLIDPLIIKALDTSGDKTVSQEEFLAAVRKLFSVIDLDKSGLVDANESCTAVTRYVMPKSNGTSTCF